MTRKFNLINPEDTDLLPKRSTQSAAGYDFKASKDYLVMPNSVDVMLIKTGVTVTMNSDEYMILANRSSNATKRHLLEPNGIGVIDADYTGEIMIPLLNFGEKAYMIHRGDRIAQGIFNKYLVTDDDNATGTRNGGFGSTGV